MDVEGVLVPKNRFFFDVGRTLGLIGLIRLFFIGFLYETGIFGIEKGLRSIYKLFRGVPFETMLQIFDRIPAIPYLQNLCAQLKARNCKVALISSGIPTEAVKKLAASICADYAYGVEIEVKDSKLTGKIHGVAVTKDGKLKILRGILESEGLGLSDCIVVADDRNNSCLFLPKMLKIGFNADYVLRIKADRVVNGKLSSILSIIDGNKRKSSFPSVNDFFREDIHATGIFMPVIAGMIGVPAISAIIIAIAAVYTLSEFYRIKGRSMPVISVVTRRAASESELFGFAAAPLYFAFGIVTTLILFPAGASGAAVASFCLGDSAASLFGGTISTSLPFNKGKTWEGSLAGFFFAFLGATFFVSPLYALAAATIAMTVEVLPLPINDNILIPIITGAAMTLLL
jgi:dolichol kinase/phosphoserine phosphatase